MLKPGSTSVGTVVRVPTGAPDPPVVAGIPEPGVVVAGEVWEPVHPASAIATQRKISAGIFMLNCIPENESRCYIMFLFTAGAIKNFIEQ
jgi:hypothetical protein